MISKTETDIRKYKIGCRGLFQSTKSKEKSKLKVSGSATAIGNINRNNSSEKPKDLNLDILSDYGNNQALCQTERSYLLHSNIKDNMQSSDL